MKRGDKVVDKKGELESVECSWIVHYNDRRDIEREICKKCRYMSDDICWYPDMRIGEFLIFDRNGRKIIECLYWKE